MADPTVKQKAVAYGKYDYIETNLDAQIAERQKTYDEVDDFAANGANKKTNADIDLKTFCASILIDLNKAEVDDSSIVAGDSVDIGKIRKRIEDKITELT